jgi:hypothetical protein
LTITPIIFIYLDSHENILDLVATSCINRSDDGACGVDPIVGQHADRGCRVADGKGVVERDKGNVG